MAKERLSGKALKKLLESDSDLTTADIDKLGDLDTSETELEYLDGATPGTQVASKAVVADANVNIGVVKATELHVGASGSETQVTSTPAELNKLDGVTATTAEIETLAGGTAVKKTSETVTYDNFTDGGAAEGTIDLSDTIPVGATFLYAAITALTGFAGDTSATLQIGDGTDVDRYNTGTPDVFSDAANGISVGDPSGTRYHDTEATVTLTVTTNADFTSVSAGSITIEMYYLT